MAHDMKPGTWYVIRQDYGGASAVLRLLVKETRWHYRFALKDGQKGELYDKERLDVIRPVGSEAEGRDILKKAEAAFLSFSDRISEAQAAVWAVEAEREAAELSILKGGGSNDA